MKREQRPDHQLSFLLPITNPQDAAVKAKAERERMVAESRARLIADLRRAGL